MDTDYLVALRCLIALILEREETGVPAEKPSKHRKDQLRELSHMEWHTPDLVSVPYNRLRHPPLPH